MDENLGPVAVSLRREKLDEHKEHGQQYNYRVIFRTSEVGYNVLISSAPHIKDFFQGFFYQRISCIFVFTVSLLL